LIRRSDLESLFDNSSLYIKHGKRGEITLEDYYSIDKIKEKYHLSKSVIFTRGKKHKIPKRLINGRSCWSKPAVDKAFTPSQTLYSKSDCYSTEEIMNKYNMSIGAVRQMVSRHKIPRFQEAKSDDRQGD